MSNQMLSWLKAKGGSLNLSLALIIILTAVLLDRPVPCTELLGVAVGVTEWVEEGPPYKAPMILEFEGKRVIVNSDGSVRVEDTPRGFAVVESEMYVDMKDVPQERR